MPQPPSISEIMEIDKQLRALSPKGLERLESQDCGAPEQRVRIATLLGRRGTAKVQLGSAKDGLTDVLCGYLVWAGAQSIDRRDLETLLEQHWTHFQGRQAPLSDSTISGALHAQVGEALRRYAGEFALNNTTRVGVQELLDRSILCFDRALDQRDFDDTLESWILAHRGAARTTQLWISDRGDKLCQVPDTHQAQRDFERAVEKRAPAPYPWCLRFHAILRILRRKTGDIDAAKQLLTEAKKTDPNVPIERGLAMMQSYVVADERTKPEEKRRAAQDSLSHAFTAIQLDAEDFVARYFAAVAHWWLASNTPEDPGVSPVRNGHRDYLDAAIESAKLGAKSAISQAMFVLAGLRAMEKLPPGDETQRDLAGARRAAGQTLKMLSAIEVKPDLESTTMFNNDPVFRLLLSPDAPQSAGNNQRQNLIESTLWNVP